MMEHVEVRFTEDREVYIDGVASGFTNKILRVGTGTHSFDLGRPTNYHPAEIIIEVSDTNPLEPKILEFEEV